MRSAPNWINRSPALQDGTLVVPDSGAQFPISAKDWRFINGKVKEVVQQFHKDGYKIVIFR